MALKINGERVPPSVLRQELNRLQEARQQDAELQRLSAPELQRMAWDNVINHVLLEQEARRRYPKIPASEVNRRCQAVMAQAGGEKQFLKKNKLKRQDLERVKKDIEQNLRVLSLYAKLWAGIKEPAGKEVFDEYMRDPTRFQMPEQVHVSHIVKHTDDGAEPELAREQIRQIKAALDAGKDFAELASESSDCSDRGGDLGFIARGKMVQAFEDMVFSLQVGEISEVFETEFGWHIAKLHERRPARLVSFEEMKEELKKQMWRRAQADALEGFVQGLREKAKIEEV